MKTISEFMELEHLNLNKQWEDFATEKNKEKSKELLLKFSNSLLKHIRLEDGALSPTFNRYLGIEKGMSPTATMSSDHKNLIKLLDKVKVADDSDDIGACTYAKTHFGRALINHEKREEKLHYVIFEKLISKGEWEGILNGEL